MVACGGGTTDYLSQPPGGAAQILAATACDAVYECGTIALECPEAIVEVIPAEAEFASRAECEQGFADIFLGVLVGCSFVELTDLERADVNECLNFSATVGSETGCLSAADLAAYATAICTGGPTPGTPEACIRAQSAFDRCLTCAEDPAAPGCTGAPQ
jgi:hypothetical protein